MNIFYASIRVKSKWKIEYFVQLYHGEKKLYFDGMVSTLCKTNSLQIDMSLHSNTLCIQPFFHSYSLMLFVKQRRRISLSYWIPKNICKTKSCKYLLTAFIIWNKHRKCEDKINIISLFNITFQSTLYHCRYFVSLNL